MLIGPAGDPPPAFVARTQRSGRARAAGGGGIGAHRAAVLHGGKAKAQLGALWATIAIAVPVVAEIVFGIQPSLLIDGCVRLGEVGRNALRQTLFDRLPIVVTLVG